MLYPTFRLSVNRVQDLSTKLLYYISNNNQNERQIFTTHFSYKTWLGLFEKEQKKTYTIEVWNKDKIFQNFMYFSELHVFFNNIQKQIYEACKNLT